MVYVKENTKNDSRWRKQYQADYGQTLKQMRMVLRKGFIKINLFQRMYIKMLNVHVRVKGIKFTFIVEKLYKSFVRESYVNYIKFQ